MKTLKLHYPVIQFLLTNCSQLSNFPNSQHLFRVFLCSQTYERHSHCPLVSKPNCQVITYYTLRYFINWVFKSDIFFPVRLQKFKVNIANTVISQDNSSLLTMDTGQLLDLFSVDQEKKREKPSAQQSNATGKTSLKTMIENLGELWDEEQYETEYNLDNFIGSLKWKIVCVILG